MNIDHLVLAVAVAHRARVSLFAHGIQGLGKSAAMKQYSKNNFHFYEDGEGSINYGYVDLRCASMESSELRGLPDKDPQNKVMTFFAPDELPRGEWINNRGETYGEVGSTKPEDTDDVKWVLHRGILVLEEVNRAEDDIHQAIFQLVYDYQIGKWFLPTGWSVVATGNPSGGDFIVNRFMHEPAFKDRFVHVFISIDDSYRSSWVNYMSNMKSIDKSIIGHITQFCMLSPEHLSQEIKNDDEVHIIPSPRSWELLARVEQQFVYLRDEGIADSDVLQSIRYEMLSGIVGQAIATHYMETKIDILPDDIIKNFDGVIKKLEVMKRNQLQALSWGVSAFVLSMGEINKETIDNIVSFGRWMFKEYAKKHGDCRDLAVAYFAKILEREEEHASVRRYSFANESVFRMLKKNRLLGSKPIWNAISQDDDLVKIIRNAHKGKANVD